ncbi:MAG: hypothetical protein K6T66_06455 [Peptococcaceae bacterium]|nr:hypothetical protein [Peptococcaceae bacterium]
MHQRIRDIIFRERLYHGIDGILAEINPVLRGWKQYFILSNVPVLFERWTFISLPASTVSSFIGRISMSQHPRLLFCFSLASTSTISMLQQPFLGLPNKPRKPLRPSFFLSFMILHSLLTVLNQRNNRPE